MMKKILIILIIVITATTATFLLAQQKQLGKGITKQEPSTTTLSEIKVASLFERVTDYAAAGKSVEDVITELKETRTDFIFRGFWKWAPCPDSGGEFGYDYQNLKKTITQIKREMPDLIFCGAIPAQRLTEGERNPKTGRLFAKEEIKAMAFDPSKWNLPISPEDIERVREMQRLKGGYYPDLTNPDFQELFLSWAEKQIDSGADAIWIDGPFGAPSISVRAGRIKSDHPFVKEWLKAVSLIVDKIHKYGYSKYNKHIYVGTWVTFLDFPFPPPNLDFVTATPSGKEIETKTLDKQKWDKLEMRVRNKMGQNFPIFVFLDWSSRDDTPLAVFSQRLSTSEQNEMLKKMDKFFREREIIIVYPVHGGYMGNGATKLAYGKYKIYNSVYFGDYVTIKELAQKKTLSPISNINKEKVMQKLLQVKVAVQYRWVTDWQNKSAVDRKIEDVINIFKDTKADFIFQGWLTQQPLPDKCSDLAPDMQKMCEENGYSYEYLKEAVSKIKKELPNIIFCGGTQFEFFYPEEVSSRDKAWEMTLNPQKWGLKEDRKYAQCFWAKRWGFVRAHEPCPSEETLKQKMLYYFPDITNADFQEIFLKRIYRQIDAGVDAIWIDMLYAQPVLLKQLIGNENHPAVQESYKAAWDIVDKIHEYGLKKGKYIYVITWVVVKRGGSIVILAPETNVDIAMLSPAPDEIRNKITGEIGQFKEELWNELVQTINERYKIPVFARIDYGGIGRTPLSVFSQELSQTEACEFLKKADEFFSSRGITFIYPVHGGIMVQGGTPEKLSYGRFNWYDALAPEFQTYETIKELAQEKSK